MLQNKPDHTAKIVIMGNSSVGKTHLTSAICSLSPHNIASTVGTDIFKLPITTHNTERIILNFWVTTDSEQYRNMGKVLRRHPQVVAHAVEALQRAGFKQPKLSAIRGGTDGSRLSFMGLPCPNLFAGEHAFHSKQEWVSVQDMEKAAETIIHLAQVWEEKS